MLCHFTYNFYNTQATFSNEGLQDIKSMDFDQ